MTQLLVPQLLLHPQEHAQPRTGNMLQIPGIEHQSTLSLGLQYLFHFLLDSGGILCINISLKENRKDALAALTSQSDPPLSSKYILACKFAGQLALSCYF